MLLGVSPESEDQLVDRQVDPSRSGAFSRLRRSARREPFGDQSPVTFVALGTVVPPEVMVVAVDPDDGEILGLEVSVFGDARGLGSYKCGTCGSPE
jgi:hypothetical protein